MIILDTHIWVWWVNGDSQLTARHREFLAAHESSGLGVSVISCWEVAKLVQVGRLVLDRPVAQWLQSALSCPGVCLVDLTPDIVVESTQLPDFGIRDPADQIIVGTARVLDCPLLTADLRLLQYSGATTLS